MISMRPPLAAIFFYDLFSQGRGTMDPSAPLPGSATDLTSPIPPNTNTFVASPPNMNFPLNNVQTQEQENVSTQEEENTVTTQQDLQTQNSDSETTSDSYLKTSVADSATTEFIPDVQSGPSEPMDTASPVENVTTPDLRQDVDSR